ncbi:MAG: hypothetical protein WCG85_16950, partial [Polyangia bacterium]
MVATLAIQAARFKLRISANLWENLGDSFLDSKGCGRSVARGGYRSYPREMIAEIRKNGQLDWPLFLVVEEDHDVTPPLSNR